MIAPDWSCCDHCGCIRDRSGHVDPCPDFGCHAASPAPIEMSPGGFIEAVENNPSTREN